MLLLKRNWFYIEMSQLHNSQPTNYTVFKNNVYIYKIFSVYVIKYKTGLNYECYKAGLILY